jgi:hypothetical protein
LVLFLRKSGPLAAFRPREKLLGAGISRSALGIYQRVSLSARLCPL